MTWLNSAKTRKANFASIFTAVRAHKECGRKAETPGNCTGLPKRKKEEKEGKMLPILQMGGRTERTGF